MSSHYVLHCLHCMQPGRKAYIRGQLFKLCTSILFEDACLLLRNMLTSMQCTQTVRHLLGLVSSLSGHHDQPSATIWIKRPSPASSSKPANILKTHATSFSTCVGVDPTILCCSCRGLWYLHQDALTKPRISFKWLIHDIEMESSSGNVCSRGHVQVGTPLYLY